MRILIACEFSGIVSKAFRDRGHEAWSYDLLPTEIEEEYHVQANVLDYLDCNWDLLIAHPPCTYLCNSGVRWLFPKEGQDLERWGRMEEASEFFWRLWGAPIDKICIENPIPHKYGQLPKYTQLIQPWQFGHGETKATCLWLKNLPPLQPTEIVEGREARVHRASPNKDRWKERSRTYKGIAEAMAEQWGIL